MRGYVILSGAAIFMGNASERSRGIVVSVRAQVAPSIQRWCNPGRGHCGRLRRSRERSVRRASSVQRRSPAPVEDDSGDGS